MSNPDLLRQIGIRANALDNEPGKSIIYNVQFTIWGPLKTRQMAIWESLKTLVPSQIGSCGAPRCEPQEASLPTASTPTRRTNCSCAVGTLHACVSKLAKTNWSPTNIVRRPTACLGVGLPKTGSAGSPHFHDLFSGATVLVSGLTPYAVANCRPRRRR